MTTPVQPSDPLDVPLTRRDLLAVLHLLAEGDGETPGLLWERLTLEWRGHASVIGVPT